MPRTDRRFVLGAALMLGSVLAAFLLALLERPAGAAVRITPTGVCSGCHDQSQLAKHPEVPAGDCVACHPPHSSNLAPRLAQPPPERCQACHFEYSALRLRHRRILERVATHRPVEAGKCTECHTPHQSGTPPGLKAGGPDLCIQCHRREAPPATQAGVHPPYWEGKCETCHAPHVGTRPALLGRPQSELCTSCHAKTAGEQALPNQHAPFGQCTECHRGHQSTQERLLKAEQKQLCYSCHKSQKRLWSRKPFKHPPFAAGVCTTCHSPHASQEKRLVKFYPLQELCFQCHSDKKERFETAKSRHPLGMYGRKTGGGPMYCVDCHQPHAGDYSRMRQRDGNLLCFGCHMWPYFFGTPHNEVEGRGGKGACTNCHNPHGTQNDFMLHLDPVTTCQQCHPRAPSLFQHPVGDRMDPDKGRLLTCASTCHNPHGSGFNKLLQKPKDALCLTCHKDRGTE